MPPHSESSDPIVVTGATGAVGQRVVAGLLDADRQVRALSRRPQQAGLPPAATVVPGDLYEPGTLEAAFAGARQLVLISVPETVREVVTHARTAGIEHIVVVSSAAVTAGYDTTYNLPVERTVMASGLAWTIVRPGEFATNALLTWGPSIRARRRVVEPFPDQTGSPIHEHDVADVILANLLDLRRRGRIDTIIGPDTLTKREQVAAIATAIGESIAVDEVTAEQARTFYREQGGFAADNADWLFGFESYDGVEGAVDEPHDTNVDPHGTYATLTEVLNRPSRSYHRWARDHASDFV